MARPVSRLGCRGAKSVSAEETGERFVARRPTRGGETEVGKGRRGGHAPPGGSHEEPTLDQERLVDVFHRLGLLAHTDRVAPNVGPGVTPITDTL